MVRDILNIIVKNKLLNNSQDFQIFKVLKYPLIMEKFKEYIQSVNGESDNEFKDSKKSLNYRIRGNKAYGDNRLIESYFYILSFKNLYFL